MGCNNCKKIKPWKWWMLGVGALFGRSAFSLSNLYWNLKSLITDFRIQLSFDRRESYFRNQPPLLAEAWNRWLLISEFSSPLMDASHISEISLHSWLKPEIVDSGFQNSALENVPGCAHAAWRGQHVSLSIVNTHTAWLRALYRCRIQSKSFVPSARCQEKCPYTRFVVSS